ncbi:DUF4411 family protein [Veillonella magna]|uniref:DUF4411 family protein n=1 Tax=Veillonella magna TaxID=464322 RepID=UPI0004847FEC|nr:DUF4411 family protein [Veillonella magna]
MVYLIDTNTLITAKNLYYGFDIAPSFWAFLSRCNSIKTIDWVEDEINDGKDNLSSWFSNNWHNSVIKTNDNIEIVNEYQAIVNYVNSNDKYKPEEKNKFLSKADPWLIATAKARGDTVVTLEQLVDSQSRKVKIPNICQVFSVSYISPFDMLRQLQFRM